MKMLAVLSMFAIGAVTAQGRDGDIYDTFNAKGIIEHPELKDKAFDCLMDRAPCGEFQPIKEKLPRILKTNCGDCTPKQKATHEDSMKMFEKSFNSDYKEMIARFT